MKKLLALLLTTAIMFNTHAQSISVEDMTRFYSMDLSQQKEYLAGRQFQFSGPSTDTLDVSNIYHSNTFIKETWINNEFRYEVITVTDIPGLNRYILYQSNSKSIFGEAFKYVKSEGLDFIKELKSREFGVSYVFGGNQWHIMIIKMKGENNDGAKDPLFVITLSSNQSISDCALANLWKE